MDQVTWKQHESTTDARPKLPLVLTAVRANGTLGLALTLRGEFNEINSTASALEVTAQVVSICLTSMNSSSEIQFLQAGFR
jgi:hypothetical protein